ncbi:methionine adenosyltransferase sam2, partial [Metarhizium acridum]|uniref:methionine adenosyltransferase sam2 n=1 Tax=Metarhizium acridum TaxID=92637 RepID=UPI001C6B05ED
ASEVAVKTDIVMVCGEITTAAELDYHKIVRVTIKDTSDNSKMGFGYKIVDVLTAIEQQSPNISQ